MKLRIKTWAIIVVLSFALVQYDNWRIAKEKETETQQITVNAPQAMHKAFKATLEELELHEKYQLKFTNSEDADFTVITQKSEGAEEIAYSPIIAVFNEDEELFQSYIEKEIFVKSDTEPDAYDFDLKKIMKDIIENPNSNYKVYYPDKSISNWSVLYNFLLYTANGGYYPEGDTNMAEVREQVDAFLKSKNTETISTGTINRISGFSENSIYLMTLADFGYICENKNIPCRVMYPKNVVFENYYANFNETGKILYDMLEQDKKDFWTDDMDNVGYKCLIAYGNYFVKNYLPDVYIYIEKEGRNCKVKLRENFNAIEIPQITNNEREDTDGN